MREYRMIEPDKMTKKAMYNTLTQTVIPRPIAFVTTTNGTIVNGAPFSYFNVLSAKPPLLSVAVGKKEGKDKDTANNIKQTKEFVVHLTTEDYIEAINLTAKALPPEESEIPFADLSLTKGVSINTPSINESPVKFECTLYQIIPFYEDETITGEMFIGKIKRVFIDENVFDENGINASKLKPIARLGGNDYATLGKIFTLERPK